MNYDVALGYIESFSESVDIAGLFTFYKQHANDDQIAGACEDAMNSLFDTGSTTRANSSIFTRAKPEKLVAEIIAGQGAFTPKAKPEEQAVKRKKELAAFLPINANPQTPAEHYIDDLLKNVFDENYQVKNVVALKDLTALMRITENQSAYAVCLALMVEAGNPKIFNGASLDKELSYSDSFSALSSLQGLLAKKELSNYKGNVKELSLQNMVDSRLRFFRTLHESQLLTSEPMQEKQESVMEKGRSTTTVVEHGDKKLIGKQLAQETNTQLEAVANELFRLMIGSAQPKTYLAPAPKTKVSEKNPCTITVH